ncbi:Sds3-like protein [Metarhizium album ARSEF 1941]|uniref:Sds3-like protein n=1 Tax=Metarhizium album (strain ARSEF 1941) TaxID=1081103 RepID=A0A0B2WV84_METAS|nr:Sds3-like protein [Metarhizium album ARSEF 1941]KHN97362.1 Sds3-like protein [Metarhizium album ARSEF 1941]
MAASDNAVPSALSGKAERRSPPAASQSKRDRKRQALMERLSSMTDTFQREQDMTYRDQLQKIQYEIGLVQRFDPYDTNALEVAAELRREHRQTQGPPVHAESARSLMDMAGIKFPKFMDEIEDLIEIRDFQLTQSKNEYERKVQEYKNTHAYKVETARREHMALTSTLRDRLINTLTQKKNRLNREKEVLEINDSNALLLNPNHFSLTNPGSPGGTHGKRATRLRKDADDLQMFADKKRKRNPGEEDGSPAPMRRALDPNSTTPLWQSEKARAVAKQNGPIYSIDKLFTDKELSLHYNSAALAAHQYILRNRVNGNASSPDDSDSGNGDDNDADSVPSAPMMERQVSHATRSTRGGAGTNFLDDKILGVEGIANFEVPANLDLMHAQEPPKMPPHVPQQYLKPYPRTADQNFPVPLSQDDIMSDLSVMGFLKQYDHTHKPGAHLDAPTGLRRILEAVSIPYQQGRFVAMTSAAREDPENFRDSLGITTSSLRDQPSPGGHGGSSQSVAGYSASAVPMSRQSSLGGVAMSRQGTTGSGRGKGRRG